MNKPNPIQRSVDELIGKELHDGRGIEEIVDRFKNRVVVHALQICDGNQSHAALLLKTHRNNVVHWIHKYDLDPHYPEQVKP